MSKISKTIITFTVLHRTDDQPEDLDHALREAFDGGMVGLETDSVTVPVPDDDVEDELVALGSDGTFFESDLEEG